MMPTLINPLLIMYGAIGFVIFYKLCFRNNSSFSKIIITTVLLLGVFFILYYSYSKFHLDIGISFLSSSNTKMCWAFCNNRYAVLIVYFLAVLMIATILFNINYSKKSFIYCAYISSAIGAITTDSLFSGFIYLEIMSIFSIIIILYDVKNKNIGITYALIHCISGVLMLVGVVGYVLNSQYILNSTAVNFSTISWAWKAPALIFLIGMLLNLGVPPFSYVITECYTAIDSFSAIILSTVSTKIYLLFFINNMIGLEFLYIVGGIMVIYSGICAIFNNDLRRMINHWMILHLGVIIAFCSISGGFEHGILGFSLFINMISMFSVSYGIGFLYQIYPDGVRNVSLLGFSKKNQLLQIFLIIFVVINIIAFPGTLGFFSDSVLHANHLFVNVIHLVEQFFCYVIGAKIIVGSNGYWRKNIIVYTNSKSDNQNYNKWIGLGLLIIGVNFIILYNIKNITFIFVQKNINYFDNVYNIGYGIISLFIIFLLIKFKIIRSGKKFGFDLIWIYYKASLPAIKIIKLIGVTFYSLGAHISFNINKIIKKRFNIKSSTYGLIFFNADQSFALVIFIGFIATSLIFYLI